MLGINSQHERKRVDEPGADPGIFGGKRGDSIPRQESEGDLQLGQADVDPGPGSPIEVDSLWKDAVDTMRVY
jgi:hypothetical protein